MNAECTCSTISGHYSCACKPGYFGTGLVDACDCEWTLFSFRLAAMLMAYFAVCPNRTYWSSWNFCRPCPDSNHIILETPAVNSSFCVCKSGFKANEHNRCEILQCPLLQPPEHGYFVKHPSGCGHVLNAACGARCKSGYQLVGSSIRLCQESGQWSGTEAKCVRKFYLQSLSALDIRIPNFSQDVSEAPGAVLRHGGLQKQRLGPAVRLHGPQ